MNRERDILRLAEVLDELAGTGRSDYLPGIVERAATTAQRPEWRFPARWLPPTVYNGSHAMTVRGLDRAITLGLVTILLLAALLVTALMGAPAPLPPPFGPAGNGKMAFAAGGQIFIAPSFEAAATVLVGGPESDNIPIFSPLGDQVAFLRHPDPTGTSGDFSLMVADAAGLDVRQLSGPITGLNGFAWAPDEDLIAFGHSVESASAIVLYPVAGGVGRFLDVGVPAEWPIWRPPDGREIGFLGLVDGVWTIHISRADGSGVRDLGLEARAPTWSPDGTRLAFDGPAASGAGGPNTAIHVAQIDDAGVVTDDVLTFNARNDAEVGPVWSPDGQHLAFMRRQGDRHVIAIGKPDGTGYREIGVETGPANAAVTSVWMWSPDGRWVLHSVDGAATWILDPEGGEPRRAAFGPAAFTSWQRVAR